MTKAYTDITDLAASKALTAGLWGSFGETFYMVLLRPRKEQWNNLTFLFRDRDTQQEVHLNVRFCNNDDPVGFEKGYVLTFEFDTKEVEEKLGPLSAFYSDDLSGCRDRLTLCLSAPENPEMGGDPDLAYRNGLFFPHIRVRGDRAHEYPEPVHVFDNLIFVGYRLEPQAGSDMTEKTHYLPDNLRGWLRDRGEAYAKNAPSLCASQVIAEALTESAPIIKPDAKSQPAIEVEDAASTPIADQARNISRSFMKAFFCAAADLITDAVTYVDKNVPMPVLCVAVLAISAISVLLYSNISVPLAIVGAVSVAFFRINQRENDATLARPNQPLPPAAPLTP